ncbi:MAG: hypothetical protein LBG74_01215 [Spirochaetaceae bacterium]|nr:hypothetical protein [Spirochaetaceae bacterium]
MKNKRFWKFLFSTIELLTIFILIFISVILCIFFHSRSVPAGFAFSLVSTCLLGLLSAQKLYTRIEGAARRLANVSKTEKLRREFSANVSHELKTPLTAISGYAEMLENGMVKENDKIFFIKKIKDESARMAALIEDIMLLSRLDEKQDMETFENIDAAELARETVGKLKTKAEQHAVALYTNGSNMYIKANYTMLAQFFFNLIDNAIKYNKPGGEVHIDITRHTDRIYISVADTGIGIPPEARDRVFERFYRVDKSRSKKTGGTGLGLAIVKHIAIIHNAEITLESREGLGTTVTAAFYAA